MFADTLPAARHLFDLFPFASTSVVHLNRKCLSGFELLLSFSNRLLSRGSQHGAADLRRFHRGCGKVKRAFLRNMWYTCFNIILWSWEDIPEGILWSVGLWFERFTLIGLS